MEFFVVVWVYTIENEQLEPKKETFINYIKHIYIYITYIIHIYNTYTKYIFIYVTYIYIYI